MPPATLPPNLEHRYVQVNGIRMHYVDCGQGEPVVLLHGFPEFWYSWRHQIAALSPEFHVIAPDQRGYNETESRSPYDPATLQEDVLSLIRQAGTGRVHLVGHDWGGAIAWLLAMNHPDAVRTLTICNVPHPALFRQGMRRPRQLLRSWYMFFFQLPWLPERLLAAQGYHMLARGLIRDCAGGAFTREDIKAFLVGWRRQGLGGGVQWYRWAFRSGFRLPDPVPVIQAPTLVIWGEDDRALGKELAHGTEAYVANLRVEYLPGVSHWVQQDAPERVSHLILSHVRGATGHGY